MRIHGPWIREPGHAGDATDPVVKHRRCDGPETGTPWYRAAVPPRLHRCAAQTIELWTEIHRHPGGDHEIVHGRLHCACGAYDGPDGAGGRNQRRHSPTRLAPTGQAVSA